MLICVGRFGERLFPSPSQGSIRPLLPRQYKASWPPFPRHVRPHTLSPPRPVKFHAFFLDKCYENNISMHPSGKSRWKVLLMYEP